MKSTDNNRFNNMKTIEKHCQLKKGKVINFGLSYLFVLCSIIWSPDIHGQEQQQDTAKVQLNYNNKTTAFSADSGYTQKEALDIGSNRGLFILSPDKKMQMRILGSVRAAFNYADQDMDHKNEFNPLEIPTNLTTHSPNYFASLSQSRIGFEVTRRTKKKGDIFIRIETDFSSSTNTLRIRHAYGQFPHLIVGQTWSLFSNVNYAPATVSLNGAAGSVLLRTPQIRFFGKINSKFLWAAGIEYSSPDFVIPDSIQVSVLQVIPDLTAKIKFQSDVFTGSIAGIITTLSGRGGESNKIEYRFGGGARLAGQFTFLEKNKIYFSVTSGEGIAHFIAVFSGKLQDAAFNPNTGIFELMPSTAGFIGYGYDFTETLTANLSFGAAAITNKYFQDDDEYSHGYNALINVFWAPVEGAKIGLEYANGQRFDKGGNHGMANKISVLLYYDF